MQTCHFSTSLHLITIQNFCVSAKVEDNNLKNYPTFSTFDLYLSSIGNKMGKKRKAGRGSGGQKSENGAVNLGKSRFAANEEFLDSEDEFEAGRDQVLLDERPEAKRRRRIEERGKDIQCHCCEYKRF